MEPVRSNVLDKMRAGGTAISFKLNLPGTGPVAIAAMAGFDCVWSCTEHGIADYCEMERQVLAAKAYGIDIIVRVARGSYSDLVRPLELDATGIMVPHVMNAEEVRRTVWQTKFHPVGRRPVDGGNADGMFGNLPLAEYMKFANANRMVMVQVEDPEPLEELDEICAVKGVDMIFFGPGDFSQGIGAPGQMDHPRIAEARKLVAETARRHGKFAGTVCGPSTYEEYKDMGYNFLNINSDVAGLNSYCSDMISKVTGTEARKAGGVYAGK